MNQRICYLVKTPKVTGSTDISLLVPICPQDTIVGWDEHICSYIEFSTVKKQRIRHVFLNYQGFVFAQTLKILYPVFDIFSFGGAADPLASVWKLSWLDDPVVRNIIFLILGKLIHKLCKLRIRGPFFDVECKWHKLKNIFIDVFVKLSQHIEHSFFIP